MPLSPILIFLAFSPFAITSPVISCPGVKGNLVPLSDRVIFLPWPKSKNPSAKCKSL